MPGDERLQIPLDVAATASYIAPCTIPGEYGAARRGRARGRSRGAEIDASTIPLQYNDGVVARSCR